MSAEITQGRTRMNMSQTAKGTWQLDVTAEYSTPEETAKNLADAITRAKTVAEQQGLTLVSA